MSFEFGDVVPGPSVILIGCDDPGSGVLFKDIERNAILCNAFGSRAEVEFREAVRPCFDRGARRA